MKQSCKILILVLLVFLLPSCKEVGIGSKNLLRAIYFEKDQGLYEARLICFKGDPSADTAQVNETALMLEGRGNSVFRALQKAGNNQGKELFYGQSELLLIGPNLAADSPFEVIQFVAQQESGRPNTGVFVVNLTLSELEQCKNLDQLIDSVELLREQGTYQAPLYQVSRQKGALLPILKLNGDDQSAVCNGSALYTNRKYTHKLNQAQTQLCALFCAQTDEVHFEKSGKNPSHFFVDSANIVYQVHDRKNGPVLDITLHGNIRELQTAQGSTNMCSKACARELNKWIESQAQQVLNCTFNSGNDVLNLANRLKLYDAGAIQELEKSQMLFSSERIQFHSNLTIL